MVTTVFYLPRNIIVIVTRKDKVNLSLGWLSTPNCVCRESHPNNHVHGTDLYGPCLPVLDSLWIRWSFSLVFCGQTCSMDLQSCFECSVRTYSFGLVTKERSDYRDILHCHVWGCPMHVLKAKLQNDQKLPKWNRRACFGPICWVFGSSFINGR